MLEQKTVQVSMQKKTTKLGKTTFINFTFTIFLDLSMYLIFSIHLVSNEIASN